MNEIYEFADKESEGHSLIVSAKYANSVYKKHSNSYGELGAAKTRDAAKRVLSSAVKLYDDPNPKNNVLLVGKVQSGKTSNLEALVALACDNGFNLVVMYGGTDNTLLKQTVQRFRDTFDCPERAEDLDDPEYISTPVIFTTDDKDDLCINDIDAEMLAEYLEENVPIFVIALKGAGRINQISKKLEELDESLLRALIIDDEGDQASLNNVKDKGSDASATYAAIRNMKRVLNDPIYFSVTATPMPNIFLNELSDLLPREIHLLHPGDGYCGAEVYHLQDNNSIIAIPDEMDDALESNISPASLRLAVRHFILASAIMHKQEQNTRRRRTQMIIHAASEIAIHKVIYRWVNQYVKELLNSVEDALAGNFDDAKILFYSTYDSCFTNQIKDDVPFDEELIKVVHDVLKSCAVVMQNGQDEGTRKAANFKKHRIYIGAKLLERGITFERLLTTYFTRWPSTGGNMDTNLQRARWFGYRSSYFDLLRLFTTEEIAAEFTFLGEMEDKLWEQFAEVEEGTRSIDDVIVLAEGTRQKPTRNTVADFSQIFANEWLKQSLRATDPNDIEYNNRLVQSFLNSLSFEPQSFGRSDGEPTCIEAFTSGMAVANLVLSMRGIMDNRGFRFEEIEHVLSMQAKVAVLKMMPGEPRKRSFYDKDMRGRIKALHRGRSTDHTTYRGDAAVVDSSMPVSIQIHQVCPMVNNTVLERETQYMFAIYRGDNRQQGYVRVR